nr:MAG: RNA-dependent RNA polymerase [Narnaviridae sp.]
MNNFHIISTIDSILGRVKRVRSNPWIDPILPDQWLLVVEPQHSFECELVRLTTDLRPPVFQPSGKPVRVKGDKDIQCKWHEAEFFIYFDAVLRTDVRSPTPGPPVLHDWSPLPPLGEYSYSVDWRLVQLLSGLRAVLLSLIDACGECASSEDFIGIQPANDSFEALKLMYHWSEESFVSLSKYWISWPQAKFLRNELPPRPVHWTYGPHGTLFGGETGAFMRRLAFYSDRRKDASSFWRAVFTIAQSKRAFAPVPDSYVENSFAKHRSLLSTRSPPLDPQVEEDAKIFVKTLLTDFQFPSDLFRELVDIEPSPNASVESTRGEGGAHGFLQRIIASKSHGFDDFLGLREIAPGQVIEERGLANFSPGEWRDILRQSKPSDSISFLPPRVQMSIWSLLDQENLTQDDLDLLHIPTCRVAAILEPLKVRLVTAMDAILTHVATPIQRSLWKYLSSLPQFCLVGTSVSESILHDVHRRHVLSGGSPSDPWCSGDYSSATDNLNIHFSKILIDGILDKLSDVDQEFRNQFRSILTEQVLTYPSQSKVSPAIQRRGQLMGSILSFVVLCMANFFTYIQSLDEVKRQKTLRSLRLMKALPVLVNGDDILFQASPTHYDRWSLAIQTVGFTKSVGKNFFHPRFFTVNSFPMEFNRALSPFQFWSKYSWADMEDSPIPWKVSERPEITIHGYLNLGLLTGQSKLTGRQSEQSFPLSEWHRRSACFALNPLKAHGYFLHYHRSEIKRQTQFGGTTLNLFAHPLKGGLGFSVPPGLVPSFSLEQRRLAEALWLSATARYEGQESEYSLDRLLFLENATPSSRASLGVRLKRSKIDLFPFGTPLPEGYRPFIDRSIAYRSVLSVPKHYVPDGNRVASSPPVELSNDPSVPTLDSLIAQLEMTESRSKDLDPIDPNSRPLSDRIPEFELELPLTHLLPSCRLSGSQLRKLTKRHFYQSRDPLHPIEDMMDFPFISAEFLGEDEPYQKVYTPQNYFPDVEVPHDEAFTFPFSDSDIPILDWSSASLILPVISETEDWESVSTSLQPSAPLVFPPIRNRRRPMRTTSFMYTNISHDEY